MAATNAENNATKAANKAPGNDILGELDRVLAERRDARPGDSYVAGLYARGLSKILEKVGEEAIEVIIAAKDLEKDREQVADDGAEALVGEVADLWFHTLVLLQHQGLSSAAVLGKLQQRFGLSGHAEKAARINN